VLSRRGAVTPSVAVVDPGDSADPADDDNADGGAASDV